jgi:hypothetical protein
VRNADGTLTYTNRGIADSGSFDPAAGTITVIVSVDKLNALSPAGSPIASGTILVGLRGSAVTGNPNGDSDETRGGTLFVVGGGRINAVSRRIHGTAGPFDINLPLAGTPGIECRSGGASRDFQIIVIFPFANALSISGIALNAPKGGSVAGFSISGKALTVNLTGIQNLQTISLTLSGVNDGTNLGTVVVPMGMLLGDVNSSRAVDSGDVLLVQKQNGQALPPGGAAQFRRDINTNGSIDSGDVTIAQKQNPSVLAP